MSMKLTDTKIGQSVIDLGKQIEQASKTSAASETAPAGTAQAKDQVTAGGLERPEVRSKAAELKAKLDEVRGMLGPSAVDILMQSLPGAALKALETVQADLPIKPGESAYLVFKQKTRDLMALEMKVQDLHEVFTGGLSRWAWRTYQESHDGPHLKKDEGQILKFFHQGYNAAQIKAAKPTDSMWAYYTDQAQSEVDAHNKRLKEMWPEIPDAFQLRNTDGKTGGKLTIEQYFGMFHGDKYNGMTPAPGTVPDASLAAFRAIFPGYAKLQKEVVALAEHIKQKALPSPEDIAVLRAEALDPEKMTVPELYAEVARLVGELDGFTSSNRTKREKLEHASDTESYGETSSYSSTEHRSFGVKVGSEETSGMSSSYSHSHTEGTTEVLNLKAREYKIELAPPFERLSFESIKDSNFLSPTERNVFAERLLTVRRLYEAMLVRAPDSPHTRALKGWMDESTFAFSQKEKTGKWRAVEARDAGTLHMASLRQDLLDFAKRGFYPEDRVGIIKDEMALGLAKPKSKLTSLRSLSEI